MMFKYLIKCIAFPNMKFIGSFPQHSFLNLTFFVQYLIDSLVLNQ